MVLFVVMLVMNTTVCIHYDGSLTVSGTTPRLTCLQAALASASAAEGGTLLFLCDNCRLKRQSAHSKDQNTNYPFPMAHPMSPSPSTAVAHDSDLLTATKKDIKFILRTLLSSILEVVKDDFAECATRHDGEGPCFDDNLLL